MYNNIYTSSVSNYIGFDLFFNIERIDFINSYVKKLPLQKKSIKHKNSILNKLFNILKFINTATTVR